MPTLGSRCDQADSGRSPPVESSTLFPVGPQFSLEALHPSGPWPQPEESGKLRTMRLGRWQDVLTSALNHYRKASIHPPNRLFRGEIENYGVEGGNQSVLS